MKRAVLYLRSSKDLRDVSIQSQRHELTALAERRGLQLVGEYSDAVESGKDWDRPGFQELIRAVRRPERGWSVVLTKDTSRIARRRNLALIFEEQECATHGVEVVYANIPESDDPATLMILRTLLQAMDEWHSLVSRQKGLAGMAENVRQGFRAAGSAPHGYRIKKVDIGLVREGVPVQKTVLEPTSDAPSVKYYLELRAKGIPRMQAARAAEISVSPSSLVGIEWNALTYAGCTTFGVYHERTSTGGYKGNRKRRPRSEWMVHAETHPAVITRAEAEIVLRALETSEHAAATAAGRAGASPYLLSGLLVAPSGSAWEVNRRIHYFTARRNGRKRYIPLEAIEKPVLDQVLGDIQSDAFARALVASTAGEGPDRSKELKALHKRIAEIAGQVDRAATLALDLEDPAPYHRKIDALERERRQCVEQHQALQEEIEVQRAARAVGVPQMREILAELAATIREAEPAHLKLALRACVSRIELDPDTLEARIDYAVAADRGAINPIRLALLPGFEPGFKP